MLVLALDTSGPVCAAGIYDSSAAVMLSEVSETIGKGHAERLMEMIATAFSMAGLGTDAIDRIAVTVGPGSFTGIRVGVSAARGLALALEKPCIGVSNLEIVCAAHNDGNARLVLIDARRNTVYGQLFDGDGNPLSQPAEMSPEEARALSLAKPAPMSGSGVAIVNGMSGEPDPLPLALMGKIAAARTPSGKPAPLYIRGADAKPQAGYAVAKL